MKRVVGAVLAAGVALGTGGCSAASPSYDTVRDEAVEALNQIVAVVPEPKEVFRGTEQDPSSCADTLLISRHEGAFSTAHWFVFVPGTFDIETFVASLSARLGDEWKQRESGIDVSFANVDLVQQELRVSVSVEEGTSDGRRALEMIAISRCGTLAESPAP
ncbi:MAG: hypothetical protein PIR02_14760 [Microbacterium enclense]